MATMAHEVSACWPLAGVMLTVPPLPPHPHQATQHLGYLRVLAARAWGSARELSRVVE